MLTDSTTTKRPVQTVNGSRRWAAFFLGALICLPTGLSASVYGFLDQGAMRYFSPAELEQMSATIDKALANPKASETLTWKSPKTDAHGSVRPGKTFEAQGMPCRRLEITNFVKGREDRSVVDMCNQDGVWKVLRMPQ
jgi:surface antigen